MKMRISGWRRGRSSIAGVTGALFSVISLVSGGMRARADEPFARSKDYDLQHSKVVLKFDVERQKVIGDVTHTINLYHNREGKVWFDSVGLEIQSVTVNNSPAKFETTDAKLYVSLPSAAKAGDKFDIEIKYDGKPQKGLYFILPDKDYPNRPKQLWTQGESEDTRYYLPTYDYPNDRLTTETILTVPAEWLTISNGKLIGVTDAANGMKTWTWRESQPSSTYLFTVVAGELTEVKATWRNLPVTYYAPKDRGDRLNPNYNRTPAMIELFSTKLGVDYPWEKYSQAMVDDFVAGGMENSSATTNTAESLRNPLLVAEYETGEDGLIAHELGHQWFGDLVTTNDWGNVWLNEGFATFMEYLWTESHFGKDAADYERWRNSKYWNASHNLYEKPIVRHDFDDSSEFDGNAYDKGGWVLYMLRNQLGEQAFFASLKHYLELNRGKNVMTSDLVKAIDESSHTNVDQFFEQWVYGAGAPNLELGYTYDEAKKQVALKAKQVQKQRGRVGLFRFAVEVEITNATGPKLFPIVISKETETFTFSSESAPKMVLFDKGNQVLKSVEFKKDNKEWLYQLRNATEVADRADAAVALGKLKSDDEAAAALGETVRMDKASGVQIVAAESLGTQGSPAAARQLLESLNSIKTPWVRAAIVQALGNFKDDATVTTKLETIASGDSSYRARVAALQGLGRMKSANAYQTLAAAVNSDSPDGITRNAALRGLGSLGDDKAVPLLREWTTPGRDLGSRQAAISGLSHLDKSNQEITSLIASYLAEHHSQIRYASVHALGSRGDASAIPALESMLKRDDLSIELAPTIKEQIERLKNPSAKGNPSMGGEDEEQEAFGGEQSDKASEDQHLTQIEHLVKEMNERLKAIENRLPAVPTK
jgi:aminopeptidase N